MEPVNHHNVSLLFTGLKTIYRRGFELAKPIWPSLAMQVPSGTAKEAYNWLGVAEGMREWLGDRVITTLGTHGFEISNRKWEQTVEVKREILEDDNEGIYSPIAQRMGESAALHVDELVFEALNNGRTGLGYDGVAYFHAAHPTLNEPAHPDHPGTQANVHTDGDGPYWYLADLSSSLKPLIFQMRKAPEFVSKTALTDDNVFFTDHFLFGVRARYNVGYGHWGQMFASNRDLTEANVIAAILAMENLLADNGKPLKFSPTHIIVPTTLQFDAQRLFSPTYILAPGEASTLTNLLRGRLQVVVSKHLDRS